MKEINLVRAYRQYRKSKFPIFNFIILIFLVLTVLNLFNYFKKERTYKVKLDKFERQEEVKRTLDNEDSFSRNRHIKYIDFKDIISSVPKGVNITQLQIDEGSWIEGWSKSRKSIVSFYKSLKDKNSSFILEKVSEYEKGKYSYLIRKVDVGGEYDED